MIQNETSLSVDSDPRARDTRTSLGPEVSGFLNIGFRVSFVHRRMHRCGQRCSKRSAYDKTNSTGCSGETQTENAQAYSSIVKLFRALVSVCVRFAELDFPSTDSCPVTSESLPNIVLKRSTWHQGYINGQNSAFQN